MCGFMVSTKKMKREEFMKGFQKIKYRGPDMERIIENEGTIGFHRLSVMGVSEAGMQPFVRNEKVCVCNGEVYGFRQMKEELINDGIEFTSQSDCEILIPMFEKYGFNMFKMLDAEYALVLYNGEEFIAARDPLGIRPLFYGYSKTNGGIMFASEAKALHELCDLVYPFEPGTYYYKNKFHKYYDVCDVDVIDDDLEDVYKNINKYLTDGIMKRLDTDVPLGFLLSGGLDSSLVCSIAAKHQDTPIRTFAVGMSTDAIDLKYAKIVADYIKSDHTEVIITAKDVLEVLPEVIEKLETWDITTIRASVGMYLICKWIHENTDIKVLLTGEISDELFGYKYTDFAPNAIEFQNESEKRVTELYMYDVLRADRCISGCSIEGRVPFGDLKFVKYVMGLNSEIKMNSYGQGKYLLRQSFTDGYLPDEILFREKAAFSDAVGHSLVDILKEYAEDKYTDEEYESKRKKYTYGMPFTKESLLYREIFESFYEGRGEFIKDFWMPNKTWDGCKVNDPSARVLSNYGDSGK